MRSFAVVMVVLAACRSYSAPDVKKPTVSTIEITSKTEKVTTGSQDVCDGESRCRSEDITRDEERSRIKGDFTYLSYGQARLLDPQGGAAYQSSLDEYRRRAKPCRDARKWKIGGIAATVVGGVVALIDGAPTGVRIGGLALAGAGVVGIVIGVKKSAGCDAVHRFAKDNQIDIAGDLEPADRRKELEEIAARFNASRGATSPAPAPSPP